MNRYQISSPRKAFAIASVAMSAITIGLAIIVPTKMQSDAGDLQAVASSTLTSPVPLEVVPERLRVDVVGTREPEFAAQEIRAVLPKRKQDS